MTPPQMPRHGDEQLSSLLRGLRILRYVQENQQVTASEMTTGLDIPLSTIYRYAHALKSSGFMIENSGQYLASERLADAGADRHDHLVDIARPILTGLHHRTNMNVIVAVRVHAAAMCLTGRAGPGKTSVSYRPGKLVPMHAGASALPLLAMAPATVQSAILRGRLTRFTAATPDAARLRQVLSEIRRTGYAYSSGWLTPGNAAVGVPVMVPSGCLCALSVVGGMQKFRDVPALVAALKPAAAELAQRAWSHGAASWALPDDDDNSPAFP